MPASDRPPKLFLFGAAVAGVFLVACSFVIAQREWFVGDDFAFLTSAQRPHNWLDVFLPFGRRVWWSYRPLTTDVFFYLGFQAFGRDAFGYLLITLLVHYLRGPVVYRLARQLGFGVPVALLGALLSVSRYPGTTQGFWISSVQYSAANLLFLVSVSLFLDYARGGRLRTQLGVCAGLVLTLLCNESGATLPPVLLLVSAYADGFRLEGGTATRALRRVAPHLAILAVYLVFRLRLIGPAALGKPADVYGTAFGWNILANYGRYILFVFDDNPVEIAIAGLMVLGLIVLLRWRGWAAARWRWLIDINVLCAAWIFVAMLPYAGFLPEQMFRFFSPAFGFMASRFAMHIEAPACLLFASWLEALWQLEGQRYKRAIEIGLVCLLVAALPYRQLWTRFHNPQGNYARRFLDCVADRYGNFATGTTFVIRYGGDGMAREDQKEKFRFLIFGGAVLNAFYDDRRPQLRFESSSEAAAGPCAGCIHLWLSPDLSVEPLDPLGQPGSEASPP